MKLKMKLKVTKMIIIKNSFQQYVSIPKHPMYISENMNKDNQTL